MNGCTGSIHTVKTTVKYEGKIRRWQGPDSSGEVDFQIWSNRAHWNGNRGMISSNIQGKTNLTIDQINGGSGNAIHGHSCASGNRYIPC